MNGANIEILGHGNHEFWGCKHGCEIRRMIGRLFYKSGSFEDKKIMKGI